MVFESVRVPREIQRAIKTFYKNARHFLRFSGSTLYAFTTLCGTKQGCPMNGTLFAIILDPVIAALLSVMGPRDVLRGYADDLAAVLFNGFFTLKRIAGVYDLVLIIGGLRLKITKTILIPLHNYREFKIRARLAEVVPLWTGDQIKPCGRYLGFYVGAITDHGTWISPTAKWTYRAQKIKQLSWRFLVSKMRPRWLKMAPSSPR